MENDLGGAENLEDGELWLPPDFFSVEEVQVSPKFRPHPSLPYSCPSPISRSCIEDLNRRFSTFTAQEHYPTAHSFSKPLSSFQRLDLEPSVGRGFYFDQMGHRVHDFRDRIAGAGGWTVYSAAHKCRPPLNPVQNEAQVEPFIAEMARARALQMHQRNRLAVNRVLGTSGHGGTGVFLPRLSGNMAVAGVAGADNNYPPPACARKGHGTMNKQETGFPPRKMLVSRMHEESRGYVNRGGGVAIEHRSY